MIAENQNTGTTRGRAQAEAERPKEQPLQQRRKGNVAYILWMSGLFMRYVYEHAREAARHDWSIFKREWRVFVGSAFLIIGLFSFESGKYCDGNTTDYLSCTRPSTYYYFDSLDVFLMVAGAFLVLFWLLQSSKGK